jgi:hypothetical protein
LGASGPCTSNASGAGVSDGSGWKVSAGERIQEFHDVLLMRGISTYRSFYQEFSIKSKYIK